MVAIRLKWNADGEIIKAKAVDLPKPAYNFQLDHWSKSRTPKWIAEEDARRYGVTVSNLPLKGAITPPAPESDADKAAKLLAELTETKAAYEKLMKELQAKEVKEVTPVAKDEPKEEAPKPATKKRGRPTSVAESKK